MGRKKKKERVNCFVAALLAMMERMNEREPTSAARSQPVLFTEFS
jgi:hypothetical protein